MIPHVTQQNVRLFIPHKVAKICTAICRSDHISAAQAVARFYRTRLARQLGDERSKLWQLGWVALYELYKEEQHGA
ncbi:MAG: hypothetical protein K2I74_01340 [Treponemataceae bacterium]|nr:hypothetical protein [Treponemataceae bacterium]